MRLKSKIIGFAKRFKITRDLWHLYQIIIFKLKHPLFRKKRKKGCVVQMLPTFALNDAIGNAAYEISRALNKKGIINFIVYEGTRSKIDNGVQLSSFNFNRNDKVIYHMGIGCKSSDIFKSINVGKKIMVYHNITPEKFVYDMPEIKRLVDWGRKQLFDLVNCPELTICDSKYNESELVKIGYKNTCVVPIPHVVNNLLKYKISKKNNNTKMFLTVGRITRNKCIEDVIKVFGAYHDINKNSHLNIVGSYFNTMYQKELVSLISSLKLSNSISFTGPVDVKQLSTYYSQADAYICMSEHEGFCIPLIEAMAFGVPIFAFDSTAVPETLNGAGFLFKSKNHRTCAQNVYAILNNKMIVDKIVVQEKNRFLDFNNANNIDLFLSKIL